jgi:hypothetical protein
MVHIEIGFESKTGVKRHEKDVVNDSIMLYSKATHLDDVVHEIAFS